LALAYILALPPLFEALLTLPDAARIALALALIAPLALAMGVPFPLALARLKEGEPDLVPWAWAVNGCASVLAAILVLFGAAYGGTLVFEYGFNVENVEEVWQESEQDHVRQDRRPPAG